MAKRMDNRLHNSMFNTARLIWCLVVTAFVFGSILDADHLVRLLGWGEDKYFLHIAAAFILGTTFISCGVGLIVTRVRRLAKVRVLKQVKDS